MSEKKRQAKQSNATSTLYSVLRNVGYTPDNTCMLPSSNRLLVRQKPTDLKFLVGDEHHPPCFPLFFPYPLSPTILCLLPQVALDVELSSLPSPVFPPTHNAFLTATGPDMKLLDCEGENTVGELKIWIFRFFPLDRE